MAYPTDTEVQTVRVPRGVAVPAGDITALDWAALTGRVTDLEAPKPLGSHIDTDFAGIVDGQVPLWDSTANGGDGGWVAGDASGAISDVDGIADVSTLTTGNGLTSSSPGANAAELAVQFGGTGASTSVSRSDHAHTASDAQYVPFAASGSLSSGSRVLASANPVLANGISYLVTARVHSTVRANGSESNYYKLFLNIDGGVQTSTSEQYQCVGFVPAPQTFEFGAFLVGAGTARTVSASIIYQSGVPALVDAGQLVVELQPNR